MVTKEQVEKVWRMASAVRGKDTSLYRKDPYWECYVQAVLWESYAYGVGGRSH